MKKGKLIWLIMMTLLTFICKVNAVTVHILESRAGWDIPKSIWLKEGVVNGNHSVFELIKVINSYLRFAIWFVCFLFTIINGFKLISARWDEKQTKEATSALLKSIIWIASCLLAYVIVNLAVKLFA